LYRRALTIKQKVLGEDYPDTATGYNNLAYNLNAQEKYAEAANIMRLNFFGTLAWSLSLVLPRPLAPPRRPARLVAPIPGHKQH
jgi:hypothetical protein